MGARGRAKGEPSQAKQTQHDRRQIRLNYRRIGEEATAKKDDLVQLQNGKLQEMLEQTDALHDEVHRPREQLADAEAMFKLVDIVTEAGKAMKAGTRGCSAFELMVHTKGLCCLGMDPQAEEIAPHLFDWGKLGRLSSKYFQVAFGMTTMLGPLDVEAKVRKKAERRRRERPGQVENPDKVEDVAAEDANDKATAANVTTMYQILARHSGGVPLQLLVLNTASFSQTIENIFSLSFLVKEGRAELQVCGDQCVCTPRQRISSSQEASQGGQRSQFILRLDYSDWKHLCDLYDSEQCFMPNRVAPGEALRPPGHGTPIGKSRSRNRPRQNSFSVTATPMSDDEDAESLPRQKGRRIVY